MQITIIHEVITAFFDVFSDTFSCRVSLKFLAPINKDRFRAECFCGLILKTSFFLNFYLKNLKPLNKSLDKWDRSFFDVFLDAFVISSFDMTSHTSLEKKMFAEIEKENLLEPWNKTKKIFKDFLKTNIIRQTRSPTYAHSMTQTPCQFSCFSVFFPRSYIFDSPRYFCSFVLLLYFCSLYSYLITFSLSMLNESQVGG